MRGRLVRLAGESVGERLAIGLSVPQILQRRRDASEGRRQDKAVMVVQQACRVWTSRREVSARALLGICCISVIVAVVVVVAVVIVAVVLVLALVVIVAIVVVVVIVVAVVVAV